MEVEFKIDSYKYNINGNKNKMDAVPFIEDSKTYIPLRYGYKGLGLKVDWKENSRTIIVEIE